MNLLAVMEGSIAFLFIITMITQVVIPLWNDRPLFPLFNKKRTSIEHNIAILNELNDVDRLSQLLTEKTNQHNSTIQQPALEVQEVEVPPTVSTKSTSEVEISINNHVSE